MKTVKTVRKIITNEDEIKRLKELEQSGKIINLRPTKIIISPLEEEWSDLFAGIYYGYEWEVEEISAGIPDNVPQYRIRGVMDFLQIPEERLPTALAEFYDYLVLMRKIMEDLREEFEAGRIKNSPFFYWIDDEQQVARMTLSGFRDSEKISEDVQILITPLDKNGIDTRREVIRTKLEEIKRQQETASEREDVPSERGKTHNSKHTYRGGKE